MTSIAEALETPLPPQEELDYLFTRTKVQLLTSKRKGFLGSLLCNHQFIWDPSCSTAWCNGSVIAFNPHFFMWLTPTERVTVLAHELWHTGFGHMARLSGRCPDYWNQAADFVINLILKKDGFTFGPKLMSINPCLDEKWDKFTTEQVYDEIFKDKPNSPPPPDALKDVRYEKGSTPQGQQDIARKMIQARDQEARSKDAGSLPGELAQVLDKFLNPILPWNILLQRFFTEISREDYSWKRPSRRYDDEYLPSLSGDNGLDHLVYYIDVSGSVTDAQMLRFHSEVKYIHECFQPKRLTLVTFDTKIQDVLELTDDMPFNEIEVHGRGGTSLEPVRQDIKERNPTAAVIFSDLHCTPMRESPNIPVIWAVMNNPNAQTFFGHVCHLPDEE